MNDPTKERENVFQEVSATGLDALGPRPRIIDVREPDEFSGELGHLPGAELVPLATVAEVAASWPRTERIVVVCRSGGRSARAARQLVELGFERVFNLSGGMLAANEAKVAIERS